MPPRTCLLLIFAISSALPAEDRIVMRTAGGSRIGTSCILHDYTGREVVYQAKAGGALRRMPRKDVLEVTTHYSEPHTAGRQLLSEGKAKEAFDKLDAALDKENRVWVRREILATQIKCALWNGDRVAAGERFLAIFDSDPYTMYFSLLPLSWSDARPSAELIQASRQWLAQSTNSAARLLAASHLLTEKQHADAALRTLKDLARDENGDVQRYGQIQLWRVKALTEDVSREELLRWERSFDDAGDLLGGGPRYILGLGWKRQHNDVAAAAAWLWLPLVASEDRWLAAEAAWQAGQALDRAGQKDEAAAVYAEIKARFADTPSGPLAAAKTK